MGGLLGAAFFAKFFSLLALGPVLVALGSFANNNTLISWGTSFQTNNSWILGASLFMVALQTFILIRGTKSTFRWQNYSFLIAMAGTLLAFIVLLIGTQGNFFAHFDALNKSFGGGNVAAVINGAPGAAAAAPNLGNWSATLPTLFSIQGFMMWNFWSVYMSGELKSASNRRRQLGVMFGALTWDTILLIIGVLLLFRIAGYNFVYALNAASTAYKIPSGPFYPFLASLVFNTPVLTILIMGSFLFWSLPSMIANTFMPIRSFFAWSFDRLMPESLANVNERTHSPVNAIIVTNVIIAALVIWSVYSNVFQLVLGLIVLAGALAVIIVGVAAIALPTRRPDLYQGSPANVKFLGMPLLYLVGTLSILEFIGIIAISFVNPASVMNGNRADWWWIPAWLIGLIVGGCLLYYVPRLIRAQQGVNISFVYKELPPE
jgi:APA family basic amino acid/polyamine antiporter